MEGEKQAVLAPTGDRSERQVSHRVHGGLWLVLTWCWGEWQAWGLLSVIHRLILPRMGTVFSGLRSGKVAFIQSGNFQVEREACEVKILTRSWGQEVNVASWGWGWGVEQLSSKRPQMRSSWASVGPMVGVQEGQLLAVQWCSPRNGLHRRTTHWLVGARDGSTHDVKGS